MRRLEILKNMYASYKQLRDLEETVNNIVEKFELRSGFDYDEVNIIIDLNHRVKKVEGELNKVLYKTLHFNRSNQEQLTKKDIKLILYSKKRIFRIKRLLHNILTD